MNLRHAHIILLPFAMILIAGFVSANEISTNGVDILPYENNILLDGLPASGVGSFAVPQRPVLFNPAAMAAVPQTQAAVDFQRYYWGIGEKIFSGSILYAHHLLNRGFGVSIGLFDAGNISTQSFGLHYGQRLTRPDGPVAEVRRWGLFGGGTIRMRRRAYSKNDFHLADPGDPLFSDRTSKSAMSIGAGLIYRKENWSVYFCGDDLNSPNLAIEDGVEDRLPMQLQIGGEFELSWEEIRVSPMISYRSENGEFGRDIDPTLALRRDFLDGRMEMTISAGRWAMGLGAVYYLSTAGGPGMRYEISQPTTGIGVPSHRLSATYRFEPPPPAYPDLVVKGIEMVGAPLVSETVTLRVKLLNKGVRDASNVPVNILVDGEPLDLVYASKIPAGKTSDVEVEWVPVKAGEFGVIARADDKGGAFPDFEGRILELDEENNELSDRVMIYGLPSARLAVDIGELRVTQRITVTEDEPVIPIVFFDAGSDAIDKRFDELIQNIADRLLRNPEARLVIEGYLSPDDTEDGAVGVELADRRAEAVSSALIKNAPEIEDRIELSKAHDRARHRAEKEKFQGTRMGKIYTAQENRRVEMSVESATPNEWNLRAFGLDDIDIKRLRTRLFDNPLFEIVAVAPTLDSAFAVERRFAEIIGSRYKDRIFAREAPEEEARIIVTAGGILYKPCVFEVPDEDLVVEEGYGESVFGISVEGGGKIVESHITIVDEHGRDLTKFEDKKGIIHGMRWDWTTEEDGLVEPGRIYIARAEVEDEFGQKAISNPETLDVILTNRWDISGRLILVQFAFAGAFGEPDYASVRMEQLTREIVERIDEDRSLYVVIGGHTDVVGVESGNLKLSQRRANEQFSTFRRYMMKMLGMDDENQLDTWLVDHNSVMSARGYGSSNPYSITRDKNGDAYRIELGNNELPEGRIVNRRVEIEFTPRRE